jgi:hypothetical protein
MTRRRRFEIIGFFVLLLVVDWFLYFRHGEHFFQGDTIFLLNQRASSIAGYLNEFIELNPSGWYRPLTNELIESILYPIAGLNPIPYRIPVYLVFVAITIGVYALALVLTRRHVAASLAAFFFSIHTVNAYTTYDVGFMPELLYAFFYIAATLAYLRYLQRGNTAAYGLSLACFVASLLSKEAAVTLPGALLLVYFFFAPGTSSFRERFTRAARSTLPHMLILVVYLAFAVGYLHVMGIHASKLLEPQAPSPGDYIPVFNRGMFTNADLAMSWAFNIPRGSWGQWRHLGPAMVGYLKVFRVLALALMALMLLRSDRKVVLFGFSWFWITLLPALPLVTHFVLYYVFLPVVGLSLAVAVAFTWLYDSLRRRQPLVAAVVILAVFGSMLLVTGRSIGDDIRDNVLLGASARLASNTLNDMKRFYPVLPGRATVYFADAEQSVAWEHNYGGLIKMAYGDDNIAILYESQGHFLSPDTKNALVFKVRNGRLSDETGKYLFIPDKYMRFVESDLKLDLSPTEVTAGDRYMLGIHGLSNANVVIAYTLNDGPLQLFTVQFDNRGGVSFDVSRRTPPGLYKFWAFKVSGEDKWVRAEKNLTVH